MSGSQALKTTKEKTMLKIFTFCLAFAMCAQISKAQNVIEDYIDDHADMAQELMHSYQVPASLILGIAIHESAAGQSKIARHLNNHFGFKGPNSNTEIRSAYRDFPDVDSSYNYFISFLKSREHYNDLFEKHDQYDYYSWVKGIQRGGYAHSRTWASQVLAIIKKYELYDYDERPEDYVEPERPVVKRTVYAKKKSSKSVISGYYTIKKGDNLNSLAEKRGTTAAALMKKNGLKSSTLQPGQKIKL